MAATGREESPGKIGIEDKLLEQSRQKRKFEDDHEDECLKKTCKASTVQKSVGQIEQKVPQKAESVSVDNGRQTTTAPIKMSLIAPSKVKEQGPVQPKTRQVASVFNESDSEEEEMPAEAKMRMRNVGRDTPTAAGPNSFGKGNLGFCDRTKMIERELKRQMDEFTGKKDSKD